MYSIIFIISNNRFPLFCGKHIFALFISSCAFSYDGVSYLSMRVLWLKKYDCFKG